MSNQVKVLVLDIEVSPLIAFVWERRDVNIATNQLKSDWYVLSWAAKWLDDPASKIMYMDQRKAKNIEDDKSILQPLWELLNEADIVVTQNGKNFDSPKLNARFIMNGMNPPSPYKHLDTYQIARGAAKFTSNSLDYLTEKLCVKYKKLKHKKFPGMELWKACLAGNLAAWKEMEIYNKHDVLSTEELYMKLRAWVPKAAPNVFQTKDPERQCKICGQYALRRKGFERAKTAIYQKYQCQNCGKWSQGGKVE